MFSLVSPTQFKIEEKQRGKHSAVKVYSIQCDSSEEKATWMTSLLNSIDEMETRKSIAPSSAFFLLSSYYWILAQFTVFHSSK